MAALQARQFLVRSWDTNATDDYRFDVVSASGRAATFAMSVVGEEGSRRMAHTAACFANASGVLAMTQGNPVTHERETMAGRGALRTASLHDTTPPFFLGRAHARAARDGVIEGLRFYDVLGAMPRLVRAGVALVSLELFKKMRTIEAERYAGAFGAELLLVRSLDAFVDNNVILRMVRDYEFGVELVAIA